MRGEPKRVWIVIECVFIVIFSVEILLRLRSERKYYFLDAWNWLIFCYIDDFGAFFLEDDAEPPPELANEFVVTGPCSMTSTMGLRDGAPVTPPPRACVSELERKLTLLAAVLLFKSASAGVPTTAASEVTDTKPPCSSTTKRLPLKTTTEPLR